MLGKEVETLVNEEQSPGSYIVTFTASNLPSGIYIYKLAAGAKSLTRKMLLLK
ncbi:MAG: T9SS type A sorting domain-containing protein [Melioribacteraceae bacterium]|nr:T9SS type A sorting domain-containing protein [Melioribacteraceae bacterium]MCF8356939.1 T9SS type A sorting domain-containing protein [Melioribacteraceae bacterium]MCF8396354.1 T9SS type A sorting domain-containing protein [Melioribacteraceae bacterium]MCF8421202.1 T9SS type A sorting domain-containing protein [Melioribacteraceae bacterium]